MLQDHETKHMLANQDLMSAEYAASSRMEMLFVCVCVCVCVCVSAPSSACLHTSH